MQVRPDNPLEPDFMDLLRIAHGEAAKLDIQYLLAGAMARDVLLHHVFGQTMTRLTRDVDLGIRVDNWDQFKALKQALLATGEFVPAAKQEQRLFFRDHLPLDLVPFGRIEAPPGTIAWPPTGETVMNVVGFAEAKRAAIQVEIEPGLAIPVASIPALSILKLIAWKDRHTQTSKDADDFLLLATSYAAAGNLDRLYDQESQLLEEYDHDPDRAAAALMGKDAALICEPATAGILRDILLPETSRQALLDQILRGRAGSAAGIGGGFDPAPYVDAFTKGLFRGAV